MKVIGLTGKACAGKNQVAKALEEKGFYVIDADLIGHDALENNKDKIKETFGDSVISNDKVDRRALGNIVFSSKAKMRLLENIVHPYVKEYCKKEISKSNKNIIINAALLQKGDLVELCEQVIFVKASVFVRYKRSKKRDKRSLLWFIEREISQKNISVRCLKKEIKNVFIVNNKTSIKEIYRQIDNYCDIFIEGK
jgi:dephospho-CoA kinase